MNKDMNSHCDNCDWKGEPKIKLGDIPDLNERLDEGSVVPSGECPECGALCYVDQPTTEIKIVVRGGVLQAVYSTDKTVDAELIDLDNQDDETAAAIRDARAEALATDVNFAEIAF